MASGNSWQLYQELGNVPESVFEALKQLPQANTRRRQRRMTTAGAHQMAILGEDGVVRSRLAFSNTAYQNSTGGGSKSELRRSYSQPRITTGDHPRVPEGDEEMKRHRRRSSMSFRVAKEKGRKLLARAKSFLDVAMTPPPSPQTWSTTSSSSSVGDNEDEDLFTTASDLSGLRIGEEDEDEDAYHDFSQVIYADSSAASETRDGIVELHQRKKFSIRSGHQHDPNCPVHGENGLLQKRVSIVGVAPDSVPSAVVSPRPLATVAGSNFMLKLARRRHKAALNSVDRHRVERERSKILRNLFTLSVAFLFLISAFQGLQNLQTTIHGEHGLGAVSLSVVYLGLVVSCLFTPPYLLNRIGCKLTLVLSMSTFSMYMLTHFAPKWYSLIPGSLLVGFGAAPLWAAKCSYLSEAGFRYAELNLESSNAVIVRFFGVFFMIVHMGQVFGNLISSWILRTAIGAGGGSGDGDSSRELVDSVDETCGHYFTDVDHLSPMAKANLARPPPTAVYSLCAVYFCCTIVAALIIAMFLNQLRRDLRIQREGENTPQDRTKEDQIQVRKPRHLLLVPLTIFNGMQQAFIAGEFTKVYVGCCLGVTDIGYVMMSFGMFDAICSLVFGPLIKLFGRTPLLMFGAVVDMLMIFTLLVWPPNPADTVIFYVVAACWGMADGVWSTQINGLWVVIFSDNLAAAFANYRLWESVGFIIAFAYTPFLITETKLYILLVMLWVGMLGYGIIELWEPLEDYALGLKQKLHSRPLPRRKRRNSSLVSKRNGRAEDQEATEKLLVEEKKAPLALEETDF